MEMTFYGGQIVLLHGFIKKDQKTPKGDLELARENEKIYFERMEIPGKKKYCNDFP